MMIHNMAIASYYSETTFHKILYTYHVFFWKHLRGARTVIVAHQVIQHVTCCAVFFFIFVINS